MRELWIRVRLNWNATDTFLTGTNTLACVLFIGNCWWQSVGICEVASGVPLALQALHARGAGGIVPGADVLRKSLVFGALVGWLWPLGEGVVVRTFGWWGTYLAPGWRIWDTPVYCILIGWLASTHIAYFSQRVRDIGFGLTAAAVYAGVTALCIGVLGENLFVAAGIWEYTPTASQWWDVPVFLPVAYGLAYAAVPVTLRLGTVSAGLVFDAILLVVTVSLGLASGFFPR